MSENMSDKWVDYAVRIQSIAQAGLAYCEDKYGRERYEELRKISAEMISAKTDIPLEKVYDLFCNESGYQTPKLDTRGAVFIDGKILLVRENNGTWSLPGGWCDVDLSVAENTEKEVLEETGLTLTQYRYCGLVTFVSDVYPTEYMHLFHATGFTGTPKDCDEGELAWIGKRQLAALQQWEGDRIFLRLMDEHVPFFSLKLVYAGDTLTEAVLNGQRLEQS